MIEGVDEHQVVIRRVFRQKRDVVFAAFTTAEAIAQWMSPDPNIDLEVLSFDFRVGGTYLYEFALQDGTRLRLTGMFKRIEPEKLLSFSWEWLEPDPHAGVQSLVVVEFRDLSTMTELIITHTKLAASGMPDRHNQGWGGALQRLHAFLELSKEKIEP